MRRRRRKNQYIFASEPERGRGRQVLAWLGVALCLAVVATVISNFTLNHQVTLTRQRITVQNLPGDLENWSILHISDLHGREIGEDQAAIKKALGTLNYSCVVFTGDMVGAKGNVEPFLQLLSLLPEDKPKILIPGDSDPPVIQTTAHDSLSVYSSWAQQVLDAGVILLDEPVSFTRNKSTIWFVPEYLYSLDLDSTESAYRRQAEELSAQNAILTPDQAAQKRAAEYHLERIARIREAIASMKERDIQVALTHTPLTREYVNTMLQWTDKNAVFSLRRVSLVLAGHYTGGQWRMPWGGALYVPAYGWFPEDSLIRGLDYLAGIPQYISAGLSASDSYPWQPFRLFNGPEITYITLTASLT